MMNLDYINQKYEIDKKICKTVDSATERLEIMADLNRLVARIDGFESKYETPFFDPVQPFDYLKMCVSLARETQQRLSIEREALVREREELFSKHIMNWEPGDDCYE